MKKVIELEIIDETVESGVEAIALVDYPAIEENWLFFKKEKFIEPESGESQSDYMSRCVPFQMDEGKEQDQAVAICISTYENFEFDPSGLNPYVQQTEKKKEDLIPESVNFESILEKASVLGFTAEEIKSKDLEFHSEEEYDIKLAKGYTVYKYSGSVTDNTRDFCRRMINLDRFYTYEEINQMGSEAVNPGFGVGGANTYSIWSWKGGANCKHAWRKFYITETGAMQNKGLAPGLAGEQPYDTPNHGYVNPPGERFMRFLDESKRELVGPVAMPNIEIPRKDEEGNIYFVKFSEDLVKRMCQKFLKERRTDSTNIQHIAEDTAGVYIFESWIVEDPTTDKANTIYGFDLPKGTWMVKAKVENEETWQKVKAGDLKGFSLEGNFVSKEEKEDYMKNKKIYDSLRDLVSKWN